MTTAEEALPDTCSVVRVLIVEAAPISGELMEKLQRPGFSVAITDDVIALADVAHVLEIDIVLIMLVQNSFSTIKRKILAIFNITIAT